MSKEGFATQALAGEIAAAVLADENDGGCDISAGLFGPAFSAIIRKIATEYVQPTAAPVIDLANEIGVEAFAPGHLDAQVDDAMQATSAEVGGVKINYEGMPASELVKHLRVELDNHRQINGLSLTQKGRMILAAIRAIEQATSHGAGVA